MRNFNLVTIDSSKSKEFFLINDIICLNCNAYFKRFDSVKIKEIDKNFIKNVNTINLCNFASLCYKFNIIYSTFDALELMDQIVNAIKICNPQINFVQNNISTDMEIDSSPIQELINMEGSIITINRMLKDLLKFIGFVDSQIANLCAEYDNITSIVPKDLMEKIPLSSDLTNMTYSALKELMC